MFLMQRKAVDVCMICYKREGPNRNADSDVKPVRYVCEPCYGNDKSSVLPNYMNLWELEEECKKCTFPMHIASGQDHRFCPNCVAERMFVEKSRRTLEAFKAKLAAQEAEASREKFVNDESRPLGYWPKGLPL